MPFGVVFSFPFLSAEQPEVTGETKLLYEKVLVKIQLIQGIFDYLNIKGSFSVRFCFGIIVELATLRNTLMKKRMIDLMSGYEGKALDEYYQERMLRIYRRDMRNPFAEKFILHRLIKYPDFPKAIEVFIPKWIDLMDKGRIVFNNPNALKFNDLNAHITKRAIQIVEAEVKKIFKEQTGVGYQNSDYKRMYGVYKIEPFMEIFKITARVYGRIYAYLPRLKITAK